MVKRQIQSSPTRTLLKDEEDQPFDHGITALGLIILGSFTGIAGGAMTVLAYLWERSASYTSAAEDNGIRTDILGPILLSIGSFLLLIGLVLASSGVCATPDWSNRKVSPMEPNTHSDPQY